MPVVVGVTESLNDPALVATQDSKHENELLCSRKLVVPTIEAMHKKLPTGPSNLLKDK